MRYVWSLMVLGLVAGCGDDVRSGATEYGGPFRVVFEVDHWDVYGSIEIEVEGHEVLVIEEGNLPTCDNSPILVDSEDFSYEAMSERFFYWRDTPGEVEGSCLRIKLNGERLASGLIAFYRNDSRSEPCFPWGTILTMDGIDVDLGAITARWDGVFRHGTRLDPFHELVERMRRGETVMAGGGRVDTAFEHHGVPPPHCPNSASSGQGLTLFKGLVDLRGESVRDW